MAVNASGSVPSEEIPTDKRVNQFGVLENKHMTVEDWQRRWELGLDKGWQMPNVHPMLQKHIQQLTQGETDRRVLVPLCGRSLDLNWLVDAGHRVVGVEFVEKGVVELFKQHQWDYTVEDVHHMPGAKRYKRSDGKLEIWNVDFFQLKRETIGLFHGIWDRGSLAATNPQDRDKYLKVILDLLDDEGVYLLDSFWFEADDRFYGPPFVFEEDEVATALGPLLACKKVEDFHNQVLLEKVKPWGISDIRELVHVLRKRTLKANSH